LTGDSAFTWRDANRTVLFGEGALGNAVSILSEHGLTDFDLLSTQRALGDADRLAAAAATRHEVAPGGVPEAAAAILDSVTTAAALPPDLPVPRRNAAAEQPPTIVALGGGRVIDTAKAIAAVSGQRVAAIPTTLSGAEMTGVHRLPAGAEGRARGLVRPDLVIADPIPMTGQPEAQLRSSAMNALAHGADSLYTPFANPVSKMTALRGAALIATSLDQDRGDRDRAGLALASILCGYAFDSALFAIHHVICQTLVRALGIPHAETNAAILPQAMAFMRERAPDEIAALAEALGTDAASLPGRISELGRPVGLGALGADRGRIDEALDAIGARPELGFTPDPPNREELRAIIEAAW
jgi:alcohol dehydrogenase class IV